MSERGGVQLEPLLLLLAAGSFIGLIFPLTKLAGAEGLGPCTFAGLAAAGASIVLLAIVRLTGQRVTATSAELRYAAVAGQFTFAIPFGTLAAVVPFAGSGIPAILQSLAPITTLGIVYAMGLERPRFGRAAGLAIGLAGVLLILASRRAEPGASPDALFWTLLALITPAALAIGNVYRSVAWPPGSHALPLACVTLAFAAAGLLLLAMLLWLAGLAAAPWQGLAQGWHLVLLQSLCTGIGYGFFFRLQQVGGPVYLSQISYVNTAVGVGFAVIAFGEILPLTAWLAVALIFIGIALVTLTGRPQN